MVEPGPVDPEPAPRLVLHPVIVPDEIGRLPPLRDLAAPPLEREPLRSLGPAHAMDPTAPAEQDRRIVGDRSRRLDRPRPAQQPDRPQPVGRPARRNSTPLD